MAIVILLQPRLQEAYSDGQWTILTTPWGNGTRRYVAARSESRLKF